MTKKPKHPTPYMFLHDRRYMNIYDKSDAYDALYESHQKLEREVEERKYEMDNALRIVNEDRRKMDNAYQSGIHELLQKITKLEAELADSKQINVYLKDKATELAKQTKLVERATVYLNNHDYNFTHFKPKDMCACFKCDWLKDAGE